MSLSYNVNHTYSVQRSVCYDSHHLFLYIKQESNKNLMCCIVYVVTHTSLTLDYYNLENGSVSEVAYFNTSHCAVTFTIDIQKVCVCVSA